MQFDCCAKVCVCIKSHNRDCAPRFLWDQRVMTNFGCGAYLHKILIIIEKPIKEIELVMPSDLNIHNQVNNLQTCYFLATKGDSKTSCLQALSRPLVKRGDRKNVYHEIHRYRYLYGIVAKLRNFWKRQSWIHVESYTKWTNCADYTLSSEFNYNNAVMMIVPIFLLIGGALMRKFNMTI